MIDARVFVGLPLEFNSVCSVYPPKVNDILSNPKAIQMFKLLTYSQEEIEDLLQSDTKQQDTSKKIPTPLEFILINSYKNQEFCQLVTEAFKLFIHEPVTFVYESKLILIGEIQDIATITDFKSLRILSEDNFFDFQNTVREAMGAELESPPNPNEDPITKRIKAAGRRRKRLAAKNKGKKGISLTTSLGAICCMGIGLTPLNIGEISYASIEVLMQLYQQKEKYQTDIDSLMAGADPKKVHPKYWIREKSDFSDIKI